MLDKARKVQSVAFDTNIIIDLPSAYGLTSADEFRLEKIQQEDKLAERERSYFSYQALMVCKAQKDVETPFIEMVHKELAKTPRLQDAYEELFQKKARVHGLKKDIKWLSERYSEKASLGRGDAVILASISALRIGFLLSWNRRDLVRKEIIDKIRAINASHNLPCPEIITPFYFVSRVAIPENSNGLMFRPTPTLAIYRPRFALPTAQF